MSAEHRPYFAHLRTLDEDTLIGRQSALDELLASDGWRILVELVDDVHANAVVRLLIEHAGSEGKVYEQAEYARLVGFLAGLRQFRWAAEAFTEYAERVRNREATSG